MGAGALAIVLLGGCGDEPTNLQATASTAAQPGTAPGMPAPAVITSEIIMVKDAVPPPRGDETPPDSPSKEYIWVPGYWKYEGGEYVWEAANWVKPPPSMTTWVPPTAEKRGDGYAFTPGHWQ